jgi:hypothetical protein
MRLNSAFPPSGARGEQVILKFLDKSTSGGLASVVGVVQVTWYPSGQ